MLRFLFFNLHLAHTWPVEKQFLAPWFVKHIIVLCCVPSTTLELPFAQGLQAATTGNIMKYLGLIDRVLFPNILNTHLARTKPIGTRVSASYFVKTNV